MVEQASPSSCPWAETSKSEQELSESNLLKLWKIKVYSNQMKVDLKKGGSNLKLARKLCVCLRSPQPLPRSMAFLKSQPSHPLPQSWSSALEGICLRTCPGATQGLRQGTHPSARPEEHVLENFRGQNTNAAFQGKRLHLEQRWESIQFQCFTLTNSLWTRHILMRKVLLSLCPFYRCQNKVSWKRKMQLASLGF